MVNLATSLNGARVRIRLVHKWRVIYVRPHEYYHTELFDAMEADQLLTQFIAEQKARGGPVIVKLQRYEYGKWKTYVDADGLKMEFCHPWALMNRDPMRKLRQYMLVMLGRMIPEWREHAL